MMLSPKYLCFVILVALTALPLPASAKTFVIDVRTPQEYAEGHIPGAINIDHASIVQGISLVGASKDDEVIMYCRSGRRSAIAYDALKRLGYTRLKDYGGIEEARKKLAP